MNAVLVVNWRRMERRHQHHFLHVRILEAFVRVVFLAETTSRWLAPNYGAECNTSTSQHKCKTTLFQAARDLSGTLCLITFCMERISFANQGGATAQALWP